MYIEFMMKTPDIDMIIKDECEGLTPEQRNTVGKTVGKILKYDEYITIRIDAETGEATVRED